MTTQLSLTHTPAEFHAATLLALGESALVQVICRATLLEVATTTAEAGRRRDERPDPRPQMDAWSEFGAALMELEVACRRLEAAGLFEASRELDARKHRRIRALDRAAQLSA